MATEKDIIIEARQGLVQYVGSLLVNVPYEGAAARQIVCAALLEEAIRLVTVDNKIEMFSAKPILRAALTVLQSRKKEYEDSLNNDAYRKQILAILRELRACIKLISVIIESTKEADKNGRETAGQQKADLA